MDRPSPSETAPRRDPHQPQTGRGMTTKRNPLGDWQGAASERLGRRPETLWERVGFDSRGPQGFPGGWVLGEPERPCTVTVGG
jgi:hypothetical protein